MVDPPRPARYAPEIPDAEGISRVLILAKEKAPELWPLFRFIAFKGVRRAESCGLRWENVDFEHQVVSIVETVRRLLNQGLVVLPPKSASARRGIALDTETVAMLREHQQLLRKAEFGSLYQDNGIVFAAPTSAYLDPGIATRQWKRIAREAGCPDLKLHGLRHAHAAGLIRAGVHAKIVQDRLGHSSSAFTLDVCGHGSAALQAQAAEAFAEDLRKTVH
jgi:integrase